MQRVHVDPQIREQEFGNFQDPGLTQKVRSPQGQPLVNRLSTACQPLVLAASRSVFRSGTLVADSRNVCYLLLLFVKVLFVKGAIKVHEIKLRVPEIKTEVMHC